MGITNSWIVPTISIFWLLNSLAICPAKPIDGINTDRDALFSFKSHLTSDPQNYLSQNWSSNKDSVCSWIGVSCDRQNLRVIALNLTNFGLSGTITPYLGNLTFLRSLEISNNNLSGFIPPSIFNLSSLEFCDLSFNSLSGSLPMEMCDHRSTIKTLIVDNNKFSGQLPSDIYRCKNLEILSMGNNKFSGSILKGINNMTMLRYLDLSNNTLTSNLPAEVGSLDHLEELRLSSCNLSGPIPSTIFNMSSLLGIVFSHNNFSGQLPSTLGNGLPNLRMIFLPYNSLSGRIPSSLANASMLEQIVLSDNYLYGPIPSSLGNLRSLQQLALSSNNLTGESINQEMRFLTSLTNCRDLVALELSENQLRGTLPPSIGNFSDSLEVFHAFGCKIKGSIPSEMANLTSVAGIFLDSNELTGKIPSSIGNMKQLVNVYLEHNRLQGQIPQSFCKLNRLWEIYLSDNMFSGPIPSCLGEIKSLRQVYLDSNSFNSSIPMNLWSLSDLEGLNLSSNHLSGTLPAEIKNLDHIIELGLSWNKLSGDIPSSIGNFMTLVYLSLAHNDFQGSIPRSLGSLVSLEYLDLSHNNLTGKIPESLQELRYLKYFNVSFNRLEGRIPTSGPFSTFTAPSFANNYNLCGLPRLMVPQCDTKISTNKSRGTTNVSSHIKLIVLPMVTFATLLLFATCIIFLKRRNSVSNNVLLQTPFERKGISYQEILEATDSLSEINLLGIGGSGTVYQGVLPNGIEVAVKVFHSQYSGGRIKSFNAECEVLRNVRHRNLVRVINSCSKTDFKALVLEFMPNGSLERWLYSHNNFLSLSQRLNIAIDVAEALEYIHHYHTVVIVHCDIKPANILLDKHMVAHVCDFGIAKLFYSGESSTQTKTFGTIGYMSPEYGAEGILSTRSDVYSYGIVLLEMFTRKKPTNEMFGEDMDLKDWVRSSLHGDAILDVMDPHLFGDGNDNFSGKKKCVATVFDIAMDCLKHAPHERISMREVVVRLEKTRLIFGTFA